MPSPSALLVCSDIIKDFATDVIMNKKTDHTRVATNIAMVVEEIMHKDENKTLETNVIADMAEDAIHEEVGQPCVKNDVRHAKCEKIVTTTDENVV